MSETVVLRQDGSLTLPEDLRVRHSLRRGATLHVDEEGDRIILVPVQEEAQLVEEDGLLVIDAAIEGPLIDHRSIRDERTLRRAQEFE